jgi:hypothetical protein
LIIIFAMVAFAVDVGLVMVARTDLQRAADAAAHAAALEYQTEDDSSVVIPDVRQIASEYVQANEVLNRRATVALNTSNEEDGDIVVGRIDFDNPQNPMTFGDPDEYNAVKVRIRRTSGANGEIPLFFARILGHDSVPVQASATAAIMKHVSGFRVPGSGENAPILPITIWKEYWEATLTAGEDDNWAWDPVDQSVTEGPDETSEMVLFPTRNASAGNFGTVNIGTFSNSTAHLSTQIREGISDADLQYHGGELKLDDNGQLSLAGNPGISASLQDDLLGIVGEVRVIPLYETVENPGANAIYTIVKFVGVRIMAVQLHGGDKYVAVQPADVSYKGTIESAESGTSDGVFSPPVIVQ